MNIHLSDDSASHSRAARASEALAIAQILRDEAAALSMERDMRVQHRQCLLALEEFLAACGLCEEAITVH